MKPDILKRKKYGLHYTADHMLTFLRDTIHFFDDAWSSSHELVHRLIRPSSFIILESGNFVIGRFELSSRNGKTSKLQTRRIRGRKDPFLSPASRRALYREDDVVQEDSSLGDVWALGVTILTMMRL